MASASPGHQSKEEMPPNYDDFGEYDVCRHGTPTRRLQVEGEGDQGQPAAQADATGQPTGNLGQIAINQITVVANELRDEMFACRNSIKTEFDAMKRDFEVNMSGRAYETGALKTLDEKVSNIEKNMDDLKDIRDIIKYDDRITSMINKYKEFFNDGTALRKTKIMIDNVEAKLKEDFDTAI